MMKPPTIWSRRKFLAAIAGTGASMIINPSALFALEGVDPRVAAIVASTTGIDSYIEGGHFLEGLSGDSLRSWHDILALHSFGVRLFVDGNN